MATSRASSARAALDLSFEELYRGHHTDVYRVVLREVGNVHDAEDVTQAAFLDAYRAVLRGSEPHSPRAWLIAIAENVRRRRYRTSQRRPREEPLDADFPLAAELSHELAQTLAEALSALPAEQRRVFLLREFAGLSYDEIADRVGGTVASIQMLLFRARQALRAQLEPPTVVPRRRGLLVPLPGWLTGLVSRFEVAGAVPRLAGAVGATALTVVGASSVGVPGSQADPRPAPLVAAAPAQAAPATRSRPARLPASRPAARPTPSRTPPSRPARPAARRAERAPATVAAVPVAATASAPPARSEPARPQAAPIAVLPEVEQVLVRLPLQEPKVNDLLELPVPPPSSIPAIEPAAAAAAVAGADAPPLPLPSLPLPTLPPA